MSSKTFCIKQTRMKKIKSIFACGFPATGMWAARVISKQRNIDVNGKWIPQTQTLN